MGLAQYNYPPFAICWMNGNVLGRTPDQAGLNFWINTYKAGMSTADLLINFSESAENQASTVAVVGNGITLSTSLLG